MHVRAGDGISVHVEICTSVQGAVFIRGKHDLRVLRESFTFAWTAFSREMNCMR